MAPLNGIVEWAQVTRRESALRRGELSRRSHESVVATRRLVECRRVGEEQVARAETNRRLLPEWPAWAPPDPELIRTLVLVD